MTSKNKTALTLLGVWNQLPIQVYVWQNDIAVAHFEKLTGVRIGTFCRIENDLNYECFTTESIEALKAQLDVLEPAKQRAYVQRITDDFYVQVKALESELEKLESLDIASLDNNRLAEAIERLVEIWSHVTMQIWYAVLLDIWYPRPEDKAGIKAIIAKARDHCGHLHERSDVVECAMYPEAGKRLGFPEREIYFLFQPELVSALRGEALTKEVVQAHLNNWIATNSSGVFTAYTGEDAEKMSATFTVPSIGEKKMGDLKGTPASRGRAKGRARVILLDKQFSEFQEGEILVALQTMVHFLPIMKKSAAILTEFGGLTSHAAIVSRELGKPAIGGISGLIAAIKTGDMIEVEADKGTVRLAESGV
ncbi:MAG TPA: PEP-utilizing enzyme [Candidatus Paceibacterota bacterium]